MKKVLPSFDNKKYLKAQEKEIRERLGKSRKLYLEFGGKLLFDGHAARTLPGYEPNVKLKLLQRLKKRSASLTLSEVLMALSIARINNPLITKAVNCLTQLRNCPLHTTHIPAPGDERAFRKLGIWVTTDAGTTSKEFFY